jgi:Ca-activated chloride channel homolog
MQLNAKLNFDLIAVEHEETVHALLELTAPTPDEARERSPATLQVVLDRSGSMAGDRLLAALQAVDSLVGHLSSEDRIGLVTFDAHVAVPLAAGAVGDGHRVRKALGTIFPGSTTNLSGGLLRGIQEARRVSDGAGAGATLVLLSDGLANEGVTNHSQLEKFAAGARDASITTSTIGIGYGYDEDLLASIAGGGAGNAHFAEQGDDAGAALASEVEGLLQQAVQAASLTVRPTDEVSAVRLFNDLPAAGIDGGFMVELGDFHAGETRRVLLEIDVPAVAELGLAKVCELELRWVEIESMKSQVASIPVSVNVVPGDEAAGRTQDTEVSTELAFQRAQRAKREATDALRDGDVDDATILFDQASVDLRSALASAPADAAAELAQEADLLEDMATDARHSTESVSEAHGSDPVGSSISQGIDIAAESREGAGGRGERQAHLRGSGGLHSRACYTRPSNWRICASYTSQSQIRNLLLSSVLCQASVSFSTAGAPSVQITPWNARAFELLSLRPARRPSWYSATE